MVGSRAAALTIVLSRLRSHAEQILRAAVTAVEPSHLIRSALRQAQTGSRTSSPQIVIPKESPLFVVAAGKAAWPMARAFADLHVDRVREGIVAGPQPGATLGEPLKHDARFTWFDAGHPSPNDASVAAGRAALALARRSREAPDGQLVLLLSGGASALLVAPAPGITLEDKVATGRVLMRAGVAIDGLNCVRKHLSAIKGGQLGAAAAQSITLAISDVHGPVADDPSVIGSGPTVADTTTFADALAIVREVAGVPESVRAHLESGARGDSEETVKPGDPRLAKALYTILGNRQTALAGARARAVALGYRVIEIDHALVGEARDAFKTLLARLPPPGSDDAPLCVLATGETTVTVKGDGRGGRNQELALAAADVVASLGSPAVLASAGTDGIDGPTDAAGAVVDSTTLTRARAAGLDWQSTLARNDAYHFFVALGDLFMWGPTGTNVGDVQVLLVIPESL